jgi:hypothetical protein
MALTMLGTFRLEADEPNYVFEAILTKAPIPVAGYGGWQKVARPRRKALTEWTGRDSVSIEIAFMLDDWATGEGYENKTMVDALEKMAGVNINDPEPPLLTYTTNPPALGWHSIHHASHVRWFIDTLSWDSDQTLINNAGNPSRVAGAITLTQYVEDEHISAIQARKDNDNRRPRGRAKTYIVKRGDTLSKIAARKNVYGDASKWRRIATANGIRDPKHLKVGRKLKIP